MNEILQTISDIAVVIEQIVVSGLAVYLLYFVVKNVRRILKGIMRDIK